jgi:hypothetical protein
LRPVTDDRKTSSLDTYFVTLSPEQLNGSEAIAVDLWEPHLNSIRAHVPEAAHKVVFDRFHIMQHMTKAVDTVRKREHRNLRAEGDERLTGSKCLWLYSHEDLPERHEDRFEELRGAHLKTGRAWAIKEGLRDLWSYGGSAVAGGGSGNMTGGTAGTTARIGGTGPTGTGGTSSTIAVCETVTTLPTQGISASSTRARSTSLGWYACLVARTSSFASRLKLMVDLHVGQRLGYEGDPAERGGRTEQGLVVGP